ncbi:M48 family metallopeptidase [Sphingorhabdus arenilitoris]|uniref:M48 family metallopeptidase n=1 Tax=Sphingorhabdus arenilitoris TaxID=1490041 RepID=A0ABV8RII8_9SPHN
MSLKAWFYDGKTAARRDVEIQAIGKNFYLAEVERRHGPYAFADLHYAGQQGVSHVYKHDDIDGWRMGMQGSVPAELEGLLPARGQYGRWIDKIGLGKAIVVFAGVSAAVVAVILWSPQWLAPLVPPSVEKQLGNALVGDFGGRFCDTKPGKQALTKLASQLDENVSDIDIEVANIDMINAVALPGGKVIIFNGLLQDTPSADAVAGVLAHEIGHVRERHVMQSLIRQMGLSVVMGGLDGNVGGTLNGLLSMGYSRAAETEADNHAIKALARSDISPIPTAQFFDKLAQLESFEEEREQDGAAKNGKGQKADVKTNNAGTLMGYLSSHPLSENRKAQFEKSLIKGKSYRPVLTKAEWNDLRNMCRDDKDVKSGFGFDFGQKDPKEKP